MNRIPVTSFRALAHAGQGLFIALSLLAGAPALAALPIQHWVQDSGAKVYLVESPSLPMVDVQIDFDAGSRREPAGQVGLANATASQTASGIRRQDGAADGPYESALDENQLSEAWSDLGAGFGGSAGSDRMSFTLRSLSDPAVLSRAVNLAARQLGQPAYPSDVWQRDRERAVAAIREANTRPGTVAGKAYRAAVYGGHPYGWEVTESTLAAISVDDMRRFHARYLQPCRAKVSIVGAVDRAQADQLARRMLSLLPQGQRCEPLPSVAEVPPLTQPVRLDIPFESAQAHVLLGQPGVRRDDPDYFPLLVGNYILGGGGFVSRLSTEVREKRGLSYSVSSHFAPGRHAGAFTVGLQTRPDQAGQAVSVVREVIERFVAQGPTAQELAAAKDYMVGSFALRLDSNAKLLGNLAAIAWHELPLDYLDTWQDRVRALSAADVRSAFQRALQPDRMAVVTLGAAGAAASR
ncbi:M16 family metallopeptidase [Ramlibacter rhizophilus]|uniref:Insulinase family protein n=1 Tax=Ramlibacter rhizophilus TaxID=1781167 RepID=A0A4Z0BRN9_9BURK|nr:pitrilysin family protein [Ramlibacter rhizophilus]TFZ01124.1 insulinase family protein [Ramlibacter rhizophilus]